MSSPATPERSKKPTASLTVSPAPKIFGRKPEPSAPDINVLRNMSSLLDPLYGPLHTSLLPWSSTVVRLEDLPCSFWRFSIE